VNCFFHTSYKNTPDVKASYRTEKFLVVENFVPIGTSKDDIIAQNPSIIDTHCYAEHLILLSSYLEKH